MGVGPYQDTSKEGGRVGSRVRGIMNEKILSMDMSLFRSWKWTLLSFFRGERDDSRNTLRYYVDRSAG